MDCPRVWSSICLVLAAGSRTLLLESGSLQVLYSDLPAQRPCCFLLRGSLGLAGGLQNDKMMFLVAASLLVRKDNAAWPRLTVLAGGDEDSRRGTFCNLRRAIGVKGLFLGPL